jgi:hypothetical protein
MMNARPWESLAGLNGSASRCTCSDMQLALVGCDCDAEQNLPIGCDRGCGAWLRSGAEIQRGSCGACATHKYQPGDFVPWNGLANRACNSANRP